MVSSAYSQPLSYADRAKKAHNVSTKPVAQQLPFTLSATSHPSNSADLTMPPSLPDHKSPVDPNGDSPTTPTTSPLKPVNVWSLRKEQMAQALASRSPILDSPNPRSTRPQTTDDDAHNNKPPEPNGIAAPPLPLTNTNKHPGPSSNPVRIGKENEKEEDDPFVVRVPPPIPAAARRPLTVPNTNPAPPPPTAVMDMETWPEVGKAATLGSVGGGSGTGSVAGSVASDKGRDGDGNRKAEKPKWVQIPPTELQATADALAPRKSKSRNHSHPHSNSHRQGQTSSNQPSTSTSASSRAHSARTSNSVSVAPSVAQSRVGSVQSSPRMGSGKGRKLPVEDGGAEKVSRSASPVRYTATTSSGGLDSPQPPTVESNAPPARHSQPHSQQSTRPQSRAHSSQSHSPMQESHHPSLPGGAYPPQPHSNHQLAQGPAPVYQPYSAYEYPQVPVVGVGPGQPFPMYWNDNDRLPPITPHPAVSASQHQQKSFTVVPLQALHPLQQQPHYQQQRPLMFGQVSEGDALPPATMMARPLPPGESEAVAGYREVLPPPEGSSEIAGQSQGQSEPRGRLDSEERGRKTREVVFGSIGLPGADHSPSPMPKPLADDTPNVDATGEEEGDRPFLAFSIGVHPGEPDLTRLRSRTRSINNAKGRGRGDCRVDVTNGLIDGGDAGDDGDAGEKEGGNAGEAKVIDLTDPEPKWEFGTTKEVDEEVQADGGGDGGGVIAPSGPQGPPLPPPAPSLPPAAYYPTQEQTIGHAPPLMTGLSSITTTPPHGLYIDPTISAPLTIQNAVGPSSLLTSDTNGVTTTMDDEDHNNDDWKVIKDFRLRGNLIGAAGYPAVTRDEMLARERNREIRDREERDIGTGHARPRRGSYGGSGAYPFEPRGGFEHRGGFEPRGGFEHRGGFEPRGAYEPRGGRRGRVPFGRGYNSRGHGRGSYQQRQQQQPPFTVTPPEAQFQALPQHNEPVNGYYQPPPQPPVNYIPTSYEAFPPSAIPPAAAPVPQGLPPVPVPLSNLSFPLDPTRWYLLGQLEYYLSPQNLAQDLFLRQQMDSRGWIPISLIASFNRVRSLTMDVRLVKDVLSLSSIAEVKGDCVRMGGGQWQQFVLPDAPTSTVELMNAQHGSSERRVEGDGDSAEVEGEGEDEDEDDIVFVMGRDAVPVDSWTAGRRQT